MASPCDGRLTMTSSSAFHIVAGLGSGATSAVLLQPADLLKTRVQQSPHAAASLRLALADVLRQPNPIRSLWRGVTPSVLRTGCGSALYFGLLNQMRQYVSRLPPVVSGLDSTASVPSSSSSSALPRLSNVANLTTGAMARVTAGLVVNPITVLKVRYESTHFRYTSLASAARDIWTREGPRGFFAGFGATAARDAPYAGLYVLVYEQAKTRLGALVRGPSLMAESLRPSAPSDSRAVSSASINFVSGVIAAVTATTLTNPFDAIKTRLQLAPDRYGNMLRAARMMLQHEGVRSMFSGLSMRIGRKALSSAFTWTVYEELVRRAERALV